MPSHVLFTIGYQATTVADFLAALTDVKVDLLVDVRRVASSRRPGFAKTALAANLDEAGIEYRHLRSIGTPADGRAAARSGDHDGMKTIFRAHLLTDEAKDGLNELQAILESGRRTCIMCFEDDPTHCHRSLVAQELTRRMPLEVVDLRPEPML